MSKIKRIFSLYIKQISQEPILCIVLIIPAILAVVFNFIPSLDIWLCNYFNIKNVITPFNKMLDILLLFLTPMLYCFVSSMILLEEIDNKITVYMSITPIGRWAYLVSRYGIPIVSSFIINLLLINSVSLTQWNLATEIIVSCGMSILGFTLSFLVVSCSSNKIEGMALTKLTAVSVLGFIVPYFTESKIQYCLSVLPNFWFTKYVQTASLITLFFAFILMGLWIIIFYKKFIKKFC